MTDKFQIPTVETVAKILTTDESLFGTPGVAVVVDPETADAFGAFEDPALSDEDAWDANADEPDPARRQALGAATEADNQ